MKSDHHDEWESTQNDQESFEDLLDSYMSGSEDECRTGEKIEGRVIGIGEDMVFIEFGRRSEGMLPLNEVKNQEGQVAVKPGDKLILWISDIRNDEIYLSRGLQLRTAEARRFLREAYENQIPVQGTVKELNKGGFEVEIGGVKAFCPMSHIDLHFCENPEKMIGLAARFKIIEHSKDGNRVVVSRRKLLEEEAEEKKATLMKTISPGDVLDGRVSRILRAGVFVDIGGIEGFVPFRELTRRHINEPEDIVGLNQTVKVQVIEIPQEVTRSKSIVLSLRSLEPDPWSMQLPFHENDRIEGTVVRVEKFGVFVDLGNGFHGLIHSSTLSDNRAFHPSRLYKTGDSIFVTIQSIDAGSRKIALERVSSDTVDPSEKDDAGPNMDGVERDGTAGKFGSLGKALQEKMNKLKQKS